MAQVITFAGEQLFATKAQNNQALDIDTFIFAMVPGQDPNTPINRAETLPPIGQRVHTQIVQQKSKVNENVVIYSTVLDSTIGPFEFNWVGLYSSVNATLVAIQHIPTTPKTETVPGSAGNTLNRNFGIEYSGIAELTGITISPETWQLDYTARLIGMDELTRQLAADMNGNDWFIGDGFKVTPRSTLNTFKVAAGAGYVSGLRATLEADAVITVSAYPKFVYVDTCFDGTAAAVWKPQVTITVSAAELDDYTDSSGINHYVCKVAVISTADTIEDLRKSAYSSNFVLTEVSSAEEEAAAFAAGALAVVRLDLIAPRSSLFMDFKAPFAFLDKSEFFHYMSIYGATIDTSVINQSPMGIGVADFTSGHLTTSDHPSLRLEGGWGIECYIKLDGTTNNHFIVSKGYNEVLETAWYLALIWDGSTSFDLIFSGQNNESIVSVEYPHSSDTENYHHVSVNSDGVTVNVFIDGVLYNVAPQKTISNNNSPLFIGGWNYEENPITGGYLSQLIISNEGPLRTSNFAPPVI